MKKIICAAIIAIGSMAFLASANAETIAAGVASVSSTGQTAYSAYGATIDDAYIVGVFGNYAYLQDSTGGIYGYNIDKTTSPIYGLGIGTQVLGLGGTNTVFEYYEGTTSAAYNNWEFEAYTSTGVLTTTGTIAGTLSSIPSNYYTVESSLAGFNSVAYSGTNTTQNLQGSLMTFDDVSVLSVSSTAGNSLTTWVSGDTYTITDGVNTGTVYINAAESGIIGQAIPAEFDISGIYSEYKASNAELLPRVAADVVAAPEPSTWIMALGGVGMLVGFQRSRRRRP